MFATLVGLAHEVDRVVDDVNEPKSVLLDRVIGGPEDECDVDLAPSQRL